MLYKPDLGSCSPQQFAITDETDGHRIASQLNLRQDVSNTRKRLDEFLHEFGLLLPARDFFPRTVDDEDVLKAITQVSSTSLNAKLLSTVGKIQIRWTDVLACHLELDKSSNSLYLYRYPSFCLANLAGSDRKVTRTTLQACAATSISYWADIQEIDDLLRETLLSYRLFFGQNKASRKFFKTLRPFDGLPVEGTDKLLTALCSSERSSLPEDICQLEIYNLRKSFPVLRCKIAVIVNHLSSKPPRTWRQMWSDRRDSPNWYTFWALLLFGGVGIMLSFIQVALQIIQIVLGR